MKEKIGLIISLMTLLICFIVLEILLRLFLPIPDPYDSIKSPNPYIKSQFSRNFRIYTQVEEGLSGVKGKNLFGTNNMGFRGDYLAMPKPADEFRIFIVGVGGSSSECLFLDDSQSINRILQNELNKYVSKDVTVKVYNVGKSGDRSDDHTSMIVHRIIHLQPDMIIVLSGINDLSAFIYNVDYLHYIRDPQEVRISLPLLLRMLATEFQIGRRAYYLLKSLSPKTERRILEEITLMSNYKDKVKLCKSAPRTDTKPKTNLIAYRNNLKTIAGVAKGFGIKLVFITQATTWNSAVDPRCKDWHWMLYRNGKTYREDLMDEALESLNDVMRQVASEQSIPLLDLARIIPKSLDYFYDDVHFNVNGAKKVGKDLAYFIIKKDLYLKTK